MKLFGFNIKIGRSDKSAATAPGPIVKRSIGVTPEEWLCGKDLDNAPVLGSAYEQVVWVYRAINVLAEQVANVPFLFSAGERGRENLITSGPLHHFYNRPHPQINRFQYWELRIIWLMLRGECMRVPIFEASPSQLKTQNQKLKTVLLLDPAQFQHIVEDNRLIGWRYTGLGPSAPLAGQVFSPKRSGSKNSPTHSISGAAFPPCLWPAAPPKPNSPPANSCAA